MLNNLTVHHSVKDLVGQKFGKVSVLSFSHIQKHAYWNCICECGNTFIACGSYLRMGSTNSCGCIKVGCKGTHGQSGKNRTKEYIAWGNIIERCYNPNNTHFGIYGGRGIIVCESWKNSYETFLSDMGIAPSKKHTIERIEVNGNYEPGNCKWATQKEQCNNKRNNVKVKYNHEELPLQVWCDKLKIDHSKVRHHLSTGKSFQYIVDNYENLPTKKYLNKAEAIVIKALVDEGIYYRTIAKELMIDHQTVWRIWRNRAFKNIAA